MDPTGISGFVLGRPRVSQSVLAVGLLLVGLSPPLARGQTEVDSLHTFAFQIGVSASSIFKLLEEGAPTHQYQIYGRYWVTPRRMNRAAMRYRHVVGENAEVDVGLRAGRAWVFRSDRRWRFYGGADALVGYRRFANGNVSYRGGLSPLFGALFFISPHVSLSFEPSLVATYARSPDSDPSGSNAGVFSFEIDGTALLILSVHF